MEKRPWDLYLLVFRLDLEDLVVKDLPVLGYLVDLLHLEDRWRPLDLVVLYFLVVLELQLGR